METRVQVSQMPNRFTNNPFRTFPNIEEAQQFAAKCPASTKPRVVEHNYYGWMVTYNYSSQGTNLTRDERLAHMQRRWEEKEFSGNRLRRNEK